MLRASPPLDASRDAIHARRPQDSGPAAAIGSAAAGGLVTRLPPSMTPFPRSPEGRPLASPSRRAFPLSPYAPPSPSEGRWRVSAARRLDGPPDGGITAWTPPESCRRLDRGRPHSPSRRQLQPDLAEGRLRQPDCLRQPGPRGSTASSTATERRPLSTRPRLPACPRLRSGARLPTAMPRRIERIAGRVFSVALLS